MKRTEFEQKLEIEMKAMIRFQIEEYGEPITPADGRLIAYELLIDSDEIGFYITEDNYLVRRVGKEITRRLNAAVFKLEEMREEILANV